MLSSWLCLSVYLTRSFTRTWWSTSWSFQTCWQTTIIETLHLYQTIWETGDIPKDFEDAVIIPLFKKKGSRSVCDNYRGISLLAIAGNAQGLLHLGRLWPSNSITVLRFVLDLLYNLFLHCCATVGKILSNTSRRAVCLRQQIASYVGRVRFEPERTGTPFLFFFWSPERRSGPFRHI